MAKFKAIPITDLTQVIPNLKDRLFKHSTDNENIAVIFSILDDYAEQNGMEFFQLHHRRDNVTMAIFTLKE